MLFVSKASFFSFTVHAGIFKAHSQTLSSCVFMSGCHWSTCCCGNMNVALAGTSRLFVRSLVRQPWLWKTLSICCPSATGGYHELSPLSLYRLSLTLSLALNPLSDTSFHLCSTSVTFSWRWQGAWGVWWARLSLGCSYCCYIEAYSKNNTLLWPQPPGLNITPLQKSAKN